MIRTVTFLMLLLMAGAAMAQGAFVCGDTVRDGNGNAYATVQIGYLCWTKSNMRAVSYADGTPIAKALIYNTTRYSDTTSNLANFGRLYTWWSAVNVPEDSDTEPGRDAEGFVQGICPDGWHIPTVAEMGELRSNNDADLHSTDFWVMPNSNTNSTGFSEVPAGRFSAELNRFEGLYSNSYMWTDSSGRHEWAVACNSRYFCDQASEESVKKGDALSVRCLKVMEVCPELTTIAVEECDVTDTTVLLKGNATLAKGTFTEYGFVWGADIDALNNVVSGSEVSKMTNNGDFEATLKGLPACGDTVWFASFAKSSQCSKTVYGDTVMFIVCGRGQDAKPCLFSPTVTDHEGNTYNTVQIGKQCWMKENLKVTTWTDGTVIPPSPGEYSTTKPFCHVDTLSGEVYYNWSAVFDNTLCPEGWHVPMDGEFDDLSEYLKSKPEYRCGSVISGNGRNFTKALAAEDGWNYHDSLCTPGNPLNPNNATGFSAKPVGTYYFGTSKPNFDTLKHKGEEASFWAWSNHGYAYDVHYNSNRVYFWSSYKGPGYSVRCIKNPCDYEEGCPRVSTTDATDIGLDTAKLNGVLVNELGAREDVGFVWGYSKNNLDRTISKAAGDVVTMGGGGIKPWSIVRGLIPCDTVWFAVFAKIASCDEYKYGDTLFFVAKPDPQDCGTARDHEGNEYNTVKIGNQCWTKENMRCTTSPSGKTAFQAGGNNESRLTPYYYANTASSIPEEKRGLLYNWAAAMDTVFTSDEDVEFTNRRGICPEGWHIPTSAEWQKLIAYVGSTDCYVCGTNGKAKSLASTEYWASSDGECHVGNDLLANNLTGFSAIPVGYGQSSISSETERTRFWSTSTSSSSVTTSYGMVVNYNSSNVSVTTGYDKKFGFSVRCVKDEQCIGVSTIVVDSTITSTSVTVGGKIYDADMSKVTSFGVYYGDDPDPINNGSRVEAMDIDGEGNFRIHLQDLLYCRDNPLYVVAFAESSECTQPVYGQVYDVILKAQVEHCGTVTDVDGNVYNTVKLGSQCWMQENLRVAHYQNDDGTKGDEITFGSAYISNGIGRTMPLDDSSKVERYGYLYSWPAAMNNAAASNTNPSGVRGACPVGWHLPSNKEWNQLQDYVKSQYLQYGCNCDSDYLAKSFCSTDWDADSDYCTVGNNPKTNNATGFSALPVSVYASTNYIGHDTWFWSSREYEDDPWGPSEKRGWAACLRSTYTNFRWSVWSKGTGASVRCVRDESLFSTPRVTTASVRNVTNSTVDLRGNISFDGGAEVTERGFCYATKENPTTDSNKVVVGLGIGDFATTLSGLTSGTLYYVRAYATNSEGTAYGENVMVMPGNRDSQPCEGTPTMQDIEDNTYNTVQIGNQCWMKENLRVTKYTDGTPIELSDTDTSETVAYMYYPGGDVEQYGYLYNWAAVMHGEEASNTNPNNIQGICPTGWLVPKRSDIDNLLNYVRSQDKWNCNGDRYQMAKHLAANTTWSTSPTNQCAVGYDMSQNNETGFSIVAAGTKNSISNYYGLGDIATLWTSTYKENNMDIDDEPIFYYLRSSYSIVAKNETRKHHAHSVRCLRY